MITRQDYVAKNPHALAVAYIETKWRYTMNDIPVVHSAPEFEHRVTADATEAIYTLRVKVLQESCRIVPASWWQHFKRDCFPQWALKRWPVRYHKATLCISYKPDLDRAGPVVQYEEYDERFNPWRRYKEA